MDVQEFTTSLLSLRDRLYRYALSLLCVPAEAEDAVQDVFTKLWKKKDELQAVRTMEAFAMRMIRNDCINRLKSASKRRRIVCEQQIPDHLPFQRTSPIEEISMEELQKFILRAIASLPEQQREILTLRDIEEYGLEEIEEITGLSAVNIRVTLSRARKAVRDYLAKEYCYERS
jgi:RNA polymerase sigma-70 factor (ECF subfamily)